MLICICLLPICYSFVTYINIAIIKQQNYGEIKKEKTRKWNTKPLP